MIGHYLTSALARFRKTPFTAGVSILTLALGLACFVAAYGAMAFLRSGDDFHPGAERLHYVCRGCDQPGGGDYKASTPLAPALRAEMPELEAVGRYHPGGQDFAFERAVSSGEQKAFLRASAADAELFELLAVDFVEGGPGTALRAPDDVVLSEDAARRLFGEEPALGRTVRIDGQQDGNVSAVIRLRPEPSFLKLSSFRPELITNLDALEPRVAESWGFFAEITLVRLPPAMSVHAFQSRLDDLVDRRMPPNVFGGPSMNRFGPVPIDRLMMEFTGGSFVATAVPLGLGALILLVAGASYANLAAAQAESRIKETGMRRVLGAGRLQLLIQYAFEAGLLIIPALAIAVTIVALAAPVFARIGLDITYFLAQPGGVLFLGALTVATAVVVAIYPAFKTARVRTVDALGPGAARTGSGLVARILVGVQFFSASLLLIVVTVIQLQLAHIEAAGPDPDEPLIVLNDLSQSGVQFETLAAALSSAPQILSMTATSQPPWSNRRRTSPISTSQDASAKSVFAMSRWAGANYVRTLGMELLAGRDFDPARDSGGADQAAIIIDESLARSLGFPTPQAAIGSMIHPGSLPGFSRQDDNIPPAPLGAVVGVVEADRSQIVGADPFSSGREGGVLVLFDRTYEQSSFPVLRIDPNDVPGARMAIERAWDLVSPDVPLRARFLDEMLQDNDMYFQVRRIGRVFVVMGLCAIVISTTGLVGIAVYVAARRRREMGVRKILGASAPRLARLLIADFCRPVLIANVLAWPVSYAAALLFLGLFADRIALTPAPFALSMAITLSIAWAAVMGEVVKAASVHPAEVLRQA